MHGGQFRGFDSFEKWKSLDQHSSIIPHTPRQIYIGLHLCIMYIPLLTLCNPYRMPDLRLVQLPKSIKWNGHRYLPSHGNGSFRFRQGPAKILYNHTGSYCQNNFPHFIKSHNNFNHKPGHSVTHNTLPVIQTRRRCGLEKS